MLGEFIYWIYQDYSASAKKNRCQKLTHQLHLYFSSSSIVSLLSLPPSPKFSSRPHFFYSFSVPLFQRWPFLLPAFYFSIDSLQSAFITLFIRCPSFSIFQPSPLNLDVQSHAFVPVSALEISLLTSLPSAPSSSSLQTIEIQNEYRYVSNCFALALSHFLAVHRALTCKTTTNQH